MATRLKWISMLAICFAAGAHAQSYPVKPVRIMVGFTAGGSVDLVARLLAAKLSESLGQPVVVENRPGATGNIAAQAVARAAPDGYTLLLSSTTALASGLSIFKKLPFDPQRDFVPIVLVVHQPYILVLHPSVPAKTVKEFIAIARSRPGQLNYGSSGPGGGQHLVAEMFMMATGVKMEQVPYKGGAPALTDLLGGRVDLMFETVPTVIEHIRNAKVRPLAVTSPRRVAMLPDVPTMREAGAGFEFRNWMALAAPAGTPADIIAKLNGETEKALRSDLASRFSDLGLDVGGGTPAELASFIRAEIAKYAKLVKASGMEPL